MERFMITLALDSMTIADEVFLFSKRIITSQEKSYFIKCIDYYNTFSVDSSQYPSRLSNIVLTKVVTKKRGIEV